MSRRELGDYFQASHGWDILAARSVWAFGPERAGPNVLLDDSLPADVDKKLLSAVRESIVQVRVVRSIVTINIQLIRPINRPE